MGVGVARGEDVAGDGEAPRGGNVGSGVGGVDGVVPAGRHAARSVMTLTTTTNDRTLSG